MYEIYYKTRTGLKLVGTTDRLDTLLYVTEALKRHGWETDTFMREAA